MEVGGRLADDDAIGVLESVTLPSATPSVLVLFLAGVRAWNFFSFFRATASFSSLSIVLLSAGGPGV